VEFVVAATLAAYNEELVAADTLATNDEEFAAVATLAAHDEELVTADTLTTNDKEFDAITTLAANNEELAAVATLANHKEKLAAATALAATKNYVNVELAEKYQIVKNIKTAQNAKSKFAINTWVNILETIKNNCAKSEKNTVERCTAWKLRSRSLPWSSKKLVPLAP
jgi:hypothetical protein